MSMLAGGVWAGLMLANMKTTPAVPWAFVVMATLLWLAWRYLGGKGWPQSTSEARRRYLRANPVSGQAFFWALLTGGFAIIALAGLWIVLFQLIKMPPNALSDYSKYPLFTIAAFILMGSLVSPLMEEAAFRGYLQTALERRFSVPVAVAGSSFFFALGHVNHGVLLPKLTVYFLVGVTFGLMAYLTDSILPVIPVPHHRRSYFLYSGMAARQIAPACLRRRSWYVVLAARGAGRDFCRAGRARDAQACTDRQK